VAYGFCFFRFLNGSVPSKYLISCSMTDWLPSLDEIRERLDSDLEEGQKVVAESQSIRRKSRTY
jgi:hypothetical protein